MLSIPVDECTTNAHQKTEILILLDNVCIYVYLYQNLDTSLDILHEQAKWHQVVISRQMEVGEMGVGEMALTWTNKRTIHKF